MNCAFIVRKLCEKSAFLYKESEREEKWKDKTPLRSKSKDKRQKRGGADKKRLKWTEIV